MRNKTPKWRWASQVSVLSVVICGVMAAANPVAAEVRGLERRAATSVGNSAQPQLAYNMLVARHSMKCLEVAQANIGNGASIIQNTCSGALHQQWTIQPSAQGYYQVVVQHSGKCLEVAQANIGNGASIIQNTCSGALHQQWSQRGTGQNWYQLVARHSVKCLEVAQASTGNGASIIQNTCSGALHQQWRQ